MTTTWHILINPAAASGRGKKVWKKLQPALKAAGVTYKQFFPATPDHARRIIRHLESTQTGESAGTGTLTHFPKRGEQSSPSRENESVYPSPVTHLIIIGGDGTMSTVINAITDFTRFKIGYIPAGSANDFALSLGLPTDPVENLSSILEGTVRRHLDIGVAGESRRFLVSAGVGFDAAVCAGVNHSRLKKVLGKLGLSKLSYLLVALKILFTEDKTACTVTLDDGTTYRLDRAMFVAMMIERFEGGGFMFAPDADTSDGLFDLCMIGDISVFKFLTSLPKAKKGTHFSVKGTQHALSKTVTIHTDLPLYVHADGDVIDKTCDISFTCLQQVLQLLN